ncbi:uncharacterized protein LOC118019205 [Mirounga leonina]|uniref:uncharacterized protein LOC118019205 n=1 Tax=Mirounga leonina TaxID=9715 RepID=UPI00156C288E|nr:uncharacterized protein LOC118019205 [Mirounga leonina]
MRETGFICTKKGALVSSAETFSRKSFKREKKEKKERAILKADFLKLYLGLSSCNIAIRRGGSWFQHVSLVLSQSWVFSENTVRGAICKPGRELSPEPNHGWHPDLGFLVSRNSLVIASHWPKSTIMGSQVVQSMKISPPGLRARQKMVKHGSRAHQVYTTRTQEGQEPKSGLSCLSYCLYIFFYHIHCRFLINICLVNEFSDEI